MLAKLCLFCASMALVAQPAAAQIYSGLTRPYRPEAAAPVGLDDSPRLMALIRGGQLYLSLNDAIALAIENNLDVEYVRYGFPLQEAAFRLARATAGSATLDPVMTFDYSWTHRSSPQSNSRTTGSTVSTSETNGFTYGISKRFQFDTQASLTWNSSSSTRGDPFADFNPSTFGSLTLLVNQPLLRGFGGAHARGLRIARNNQQVTELDFREQVISTVSNVVQLYWDLASYAENVRVNQQALDVAQQLLRDNQVRVDAGQRAPVTIVESQADVARRQQQVTIAEGRLRQQEKRLKAVLSRTGLENPLLAEARVVTTDRLAEPSDDWVRPVDDYVKLAVSNRPDLQRADVQIENAQIALEGNAENLRPDLSVYTRWQNNGLAGRSNPLNPDSNTDPFFIGGFGNVVGQLLRRNFPDYEFGLSLQIPINNRAAKENYAISSLQVRRQQIDRQRQLNGVRAEIESVLVTLDQARITYEGAQRERELREQLLAAQQQRYTLGAVEAFFVIQYQTDLVNAQSAEVSALVDYVQARANLDRVIGETLDTYQINLDEARAGRMSWQPAQVP